MEGLGSWLSRMRWRRRGAWMWPAFVALSVADALIGHALPASGDRERLSDALLSALFFNLIVVAVLARIGARLLRRGRRDLPAIVARDYAGTGLLVTLTVALAVAGFAHRPTIDSHHRKLVEAVARAQAWIGDRAPAEFRRNVAEADTLTIETGVYRTCVRGDMSARTYCVVVKTDMPLADSVRFDGYESNAVFDQGVG
jgi:hypothetical protein